MTVLGARPGDIGDCLIGGSSAACERVYFGYYLWPRLQRELEELELLPHSPLPVPPGPGPDPTWLLQELVPVLLASHFGNPNLKPALPVAFRLQVTTKFRDGLMRLVADLDKEIEQLKIKPK